jgi:EAL domain-containing protein (putative c-di-GMP-specific phosphodiesterase class I)
VRNTFKWLSENRDHLHRLTHCNINLSGQTVADKDAKNFILACFAQYNIPFHKICFEVTESMAIVKIDEAVDFIQELRQKGCLFALDDFGSGFSSYSYLKQLPVDFLKIDGSFVKDILTDKIDSALVTSINDVAKAIGMHTVAEFVESTETISHLNAIGINYAQGFAIARPRPLKEFEPLASQEVDVELPADGILPV